MAIIQLPSKKYQVKVRGSDGRWITRSFSLKADALSFQREIFQQKETGETISGQNRRITLDEYWALWFETVEYQASKGWRKNQRQLYRDYIQRVIGSRTLLTIRPPNISRVLSEMAMSGKSEQTRLHVYALLRKMFGDAIELFQIMDRNPVLRTLKPKLSLQETRYFNLEQTKILLEHVRDRPYGVAIWLGIYLGLRVGEIQAVRWEDVDLNDGIIYIRRTWVRHEYRFKEYPKGRKHHSHRIPYELLELLKSNRKTSDNDLVVTSSRGYVMPYEKYFRALREYCAELGLPAIGTHGLRHSSSGVYMSYGASRDDLRQLFGHSSLSVTERYIHHRGSHLDKVANVIELFPKKCSINVPRKEIEEQCKEAPKTK